MKFVWIVANVVSELCGDAISKNRRFIMCVECSIKRSADVVNVNELELTQNPV